MKRGKLIGGRRGGDVEGNVRSRELKESSGSISHISISVKNVHEIIDFLRLFRHLWGFYWKIFTIFTLRTFQMPGQTIKCHDFSLKFSINAAKSLQKLEIGKIQVQIHQNLYLLSILSWGAAMYPFAAQTSIKLIVTKFKWFIL